MRREAIDPKTRLFGVGFVAAGIAFQAFWLGWAAGFVSVALVGCLGLWLNTDWHVTPRIIPLVFVGIAVFFAHAGEEYLTGLAVELPALFDQPAWPQSRWIVFNAVFAAAFVAGGIALRPGRSFPVLIVLFLAIAGGVANGIVHLGLVVAQGGYFPGAWSAPLMLVVGALILRELYFRHSAVADG